METKDQLLIEMRKTDETVNELKDLLTPEQAGKFLLLSDKVSSPYLEPLILFYFRAQLKLNQEFDMFTSTETSKRRKESLQPVFDRLKTDQDGRLLLQRAEEKNVDESHEAAVGLGLQ